MDRDKQENKEKRKSKDCCLYSKNALTGSGADFGRPNYLSASVNFTLIRLLISSDC
jgi:hypothetical protein